jgi:uncharacterized protein (DUF2141 family)
LDVRKKRKETETMNVHFFTNRIALHSLICCALLASSAIVAAAQTTAQPSPAPAAAASSAPAAAPSSAPAAPAQAVTAPSAPSQASSTLTVKIKGIRNTKGKIGVVLYGDAKGFPLDPSSAVAAKKVDVDPQTLTATVVFEKLPQGTYAATVLHDENLVGKMEFDSSGTPIEGYGIPNNPDTSEGPPSFDDAKFTVNQPDSAIEIAMVYWQ